MAHVSVNNVGRSMAVVMAVDVGNIKGFFLSTMLTNSFHLASVHGAQEGSNGVSRINL